MFEDVIRMSIFFIYTFTVLGAQFERDTISSTFSDDTVGSVSLPRV